jgi:hypothetical protein
MLAKTYQLNPTTGIASRSWNEIRTRACQEIIKRWEVACYHLGLSFNGGRRSHSPQERGRFLFELDDLPTLISLVRQKLPEQVQETVRRAKCICRHQFDLLGYEQLECGAEIDWHRDVVHAKRAPLKPWYQIRFLDFEEVGDAKIIWELNRHQHLSTLAKAYHFTRDLRFAEEVFRQWYHWWQQNPYPIGINWASSLEVAFRSLSWLWVQRLLEGCPVTPNRFAQDLLRALGISGRHIERYLSTYFSPNTHLLGEGVALFFIGTMCPELSAARRWQHLGWEIVLREACRQVQADGMYFEQSVYYHVYALDFFLHARTLAIANRIVVPPSFDHTLEKMLGVLCGLSQGGSLPRLGDDDGGRLFDSQRNRAQHLLDPLAIGAILFERADFKACTRLSEEAIWLLGRDGVAKFDRISTAIPAPRSVRFQASGIYVMAANEPVRHKAVIDAGLLGPGRAGHGHADALSLCLSVDSRDWLVDPGTCAYVCGGAERNLFRGTAAHNTLQVDHLDQAEPAGAFSWRSQPDVRVESWVVADTFDVLVASHAGYHRLQDPVEHRRCVFYLKSQFWLVVDVAVGKGTHHLELFWHLAPGSVLQENTLDRVYFRAEDLSAIALLTTENHGWTREITTGWSSPAYGKKEPAPILQFRKQTPIPTEFATLLYPWQADRPDLGHLVQMKTAERAENFHGYLYRTAHEDHYIVFSNQPCHWTSGIWSSDASFLYCGVTAQGFLRHLALSGGSFVELDRRRVFSARRPVGLFEWRQGRAGEQMSCSDEKAIDLVPQRSLSNAAVVLAGDQVQNTEWEAS